MFGNFAPVLEDIRSRSWASATFTGARHMLALRLDGTGADAAADAFLAALDSREFNLRGHIVADIGLVSDERSTGPGGAPRVRIRIEALTVEEG
jgi:hypothetical protein